MGLLLLLGTEDAAQHAVKDLLQQHSNTAAAVAAAEASNKEAAKGILHLATETTTICTYPQHLRMPCCSNSCSVLGGRACYQLA
jgi:hypothetical protein